jgi:HSP20 family protein
MSNIMKKANGQVATVGTVVDQIFQNNLSRFFDDDFWDAGRLTSRQPVPVNIRHTETTYEMELIAPGLSKEDFRLAVAGDTFSVSFEHKEERQQDDKEGGWLKKEYQQQSFTRSFNLDDTIDTQKISARYENGILYITLPKKENAQKLSRTISVS